MIGWFILVLLIIAGIFFLTGYKDGWDGHIQTSKWWCPECGSDENEYICHQCGKWDNRWMWSSDEGFVPKIKRNKWWKDLTAKENKRRGAG